MGIHPTLRALLHLVIVCAVLGIAIVLLTFAWDLFWWAMERWERRR